MQNLLSISLQEDNSLLVTSDVFTLTLKDANTLTALSRRLLRPEDYKSLHPTLKDKLIQWRRAKSREKNVSAFVVIPNSTLFAISDLAPSDEESLLCIPGFGPVRYASYGEEILNLVNNCMKEESIQV